MSYDQIRSMNSVRLIGKLGRDPEVKAWPNGEKYCNFSVATTESWKDKNTGEWKNVVEWHNISVTNSKLAEKVGAKCQKGCTVMVTGMLKTRKWRKQDGSEGEIKEIKVGPMDEVVYLAPPFDPNAQPTNSQGGQPRRSPPSQAQNSAWDLDDEVPFN